MPKKKSIQQMGGEAIRDKKGPGYFSKLRKDGWKKVRAQKKKEAAAQ